MSVELPVLRLGLAGFSLEQKQTLEAALRMAAPAGVTWQLTRFSEADAWWVNGPSAELRADGTLRVSPRCPTERSLQLDLQQVDRPVAFALPVAMNGYEPSFSFDEQSLPSMQLVLDKFTRWLTPQAAQFALAARILQDESVLGGGIYHVSRDGVLLAVVNLHGDIGVSPSACPEDFEDAIWNKRPPSATAIPEPFARASLSELMWRYAVRTARDVLPRRYRTGTLYFRRSPKLAQRELKDSHLLLIRELAAAPGDFGALQRRTKLHPAQLARDLAALYLVGSITSNPQRAATAQRPRRDAAESRPPGLPSMPPPLDSLLPSVPPSELPPPVYDMTAPAPMSSR